MAVVGIIRKSSARTLLINCNNFLFTISKGYKKLAVLRLSVIFALCSKKSVGAGTVLFNIKSKLRFARENFSGSSPLKRFCISQNQVSNKTSVENLSYPP